MFAKTFMWSKIGRQRQFHLHGDKLIIRKSITTLHYYCIAVYQLCQDCNMDLEFSKQTKNLGYKQVLNDC